MYSSVHSLANRHSLALYRAIPITHFTPQTKLKPFATHSQPQFENKWWNLVQNLGQSLLLLFNPSKGKGVPATSKVTKGNGEVQKVTFDFLKGTRNDASGWKPQTTRWGVKCSRERRSRESIIVWLERAVSPAAAICSWEHAVEHGVHLAAGQVEMSLLQFVWLNETSAASNLLPYCTALLSSHPHLSPADHPPPPTHSGGGGCSPGCSWTTNPSLQPAVHPGTPRLHPNTVFPQVLRAATAQFLVHEFR